MPRFFNITLTIAAEHANDAQQKMYKINDLAGAADIPVYDDCCDEIKDDNLLSELQEAAREHEVVLDDMADDG